MQYRIRTITLEEYEVAREILALVPRELCARFVVVPVSRARTSRIVAMADPTNTEAAVRAAIRKHYGDE